jgi:hypothetical protein
MGKTGTYAAARRSVEGGDDGIRSLLQIFRALNWPKARVCSKTGLFWGGVTESKGTFKLLMLIIA